MTDTVKSSAGTALANLKGRLVGRQRELELVLAALDAGRHILIEGPPGTGKSTLLRAVADELGVGFEFVEGNAELTPARLVGHFDPARVLAEGYDPDVFVDGALVTAMRDGSLLYVEELNRVPEETLNVLITVMSERELHVPRLGRIIADPGFRLVAAMNPFDAVGTARISSAVYDRVCRLSVDYQTAKEEKAIVSRATPTADDRWLEKIVELVRRTRSHPDLRVGSSVRGALDATAVVSSLAALREQTITTPSVGLDAILIALSGRVRLREGSLRTSEEIITELWGEIFGTTEPDGDGANTGKATAPTGASPG
jgi:MoxR-like ATPase